MNKKRVALALAAALGINTLMVTVGQVGGQLTVAHAQNARLANPEATVLAKVETLKTTVKSVDEQGNVVLTFDGVTKTSNIRNLKVVYTPFESTGTGQTLETPTVKDGEVTVAGVVNPGIYTLTLEVDGKAFTVTFRQTSNKNVLTAKTVTVGTNSIKVDGIAVNGTNVTNGKVHLIKKGSKTPEATVNVTSGSVTFSDMTVGKVGDVYELVYLDSSDKEVARTQLLIVKEDAKVMAYPTNEATAASDIEKQLKLDYGIENLDSTTTPALVADTVKDVTVSFKDQNNKEILSYVQTRAGAETDNKFGGANLTTSVSSDGNTLNVELSKEVTALSPNFVPGLVLGKVGTGQDGQATAASVAFGEYTIQFDKGTVSTYANESSKLSVGTPSVIKNSGGTESYVNLTGGVEVANNIDVKATVTNPKYSIDLTNLDHGYQTVAVTFDVKDGTISGGSTIKDLNDGLTHSEKLVPEYANPTVNKPVKTAIVISKDTREGSVVNASFSGTGTSGTFTLTGAEEAFKGVNGAELVNKGEISIEGATVLFNDSASDNNKLVFNVTFDEKHTGSSNWKLGNLSGTIRSQSVEVVNLDSAKIVDTKGSQDQVTLEVDFNVNELDRVAQTTFSGNGMKETGLGQINFNDLKTGSYDVKVTTSGEYGGVYTTGVYVEKNEIGIKITAEAASNASATIKIDAFLNGQKPENIKSGKIEYRELTIDDKGTTDTKDDVVTKYGDWTNANVAFGSVDFKEEEIVKNVTTGLTAGKTYEFRVVYEYQAPGTSKVDVYSNISNRVKVLTSNNNSTITGNGSSSSTTGTSTGSTTINVTTSNSTLSGTSASVTLPSGFRYDSSKTPVAVTFKYKDKDGKVVTETKEQFSNVTAKFNGDKVEVNGLVPGKNYDEITVDYTDNNGRTRSIILRNIQTSTTVESEKYLANVYEVVLSRPADEAGYHFHLNNLKNKKVSLREFLLNMLSEKEFIEKYKSTEEKIEGLYNAIVARSSDEAGKKFWVDEYKKVLAVYGSETTALKAIADRMVNENELKELADKMGVQW